MPRSRSKEVHGKFGTHVFMRRLGVVGAPLLDMGVLNAPPQVQNEVQKLDSYDERGGAQVLDETDVTRFKETMRVQTRNQQAEVLALFLGAASADEFTQAATPVVDQEHDANLGAWIALTDAAGKRAFNVGSVTVTDAGGLETFDPGDDYILDAAKGMIFIPTDSSITEGETIEVSFTPAAMTSWKIDPQTLVQGVEVYLEMWEVAETGAKQRVRTIPRAKVTATGAATRGATVDNFSELSVEVIEPGEMVGVLGLGGAPIGAP